MKDNKKKTSESPFSGLKDLLARNANSTGLVPDALQDEKKKLLAPSSEPLLKKNETPSDDDESVLFFSAMQSVEYIPSKRSDKKASAAKRTEASTVLNKKIDAYSKVGQKLNQTSAEELALRTSSHRVVGPSSAANDDGKNALGKHVDKPSDRDLFTKAMNGVAPVNSKGREIAQHGKSLKTMASAPINMMQQVLEGNIEFSLLHTDEYIEGYVVGVDPMIMGQLRAGELSPEAHIDLHGQNLQQAYSSLTIFLKNAYQRGLRTVLVITGRGKNSPFGIGVIRSSLQEWLTRNPFKRVVLGFCSARPHDGGAGAVYVMLRKYKKSHGKVIWDIPFHGSEEM